jgi:hypothetical protein
MTAEKELVKKMEVVMTPRFTAEPDEIQGGVT